MEFLPRLIPSTSRACQCQKQNALGARCQCHDPGQASQAACQRRNPRQAACRHPSQAAQCQGTRQGSRCQSHSQSLRACHRQTWSKMPNLRAWHTGMLQMMGRHTGMRRNPRQAACRHPSQAAQCQGARQKSRCRSHNQSLQTWSKMPSLRAWHTGMLQMMGRPLPAPLAWCLV